MALHDYIEDDNMDEFKRMIHEGADINQKDDFGRPPLHVAVNMGNIEMIELLLVKGANINSVDEKGDSPLFKITTDDGQIISLLLGYGANPNIENKDGRTILDKAYEENLVDVVRILHRHGAKSTIKPGDYGLDIDNY